MIETEESGDARENEQVEGKESHCKLKRLVCVDEMR